MSKEDKLNGWNDNKSIVGGVGGSQPKEESIQEWIEKEIYNHLDSLPYAGGYPSDWQETLAKHLTTKLQAEQGELKKKLEYFIKSADAYNNAYQERQKEVIELRAELQLKDKEIKQVESEYEHWENQAILMGAKVDAQIKEIDEKDKMIKELQEDNAKYVGIAHAMIEAGEKIERLQEERAEAIKNCNKLGEAVSETMQMVIKKEELIKAAHYAGWYNGLVNAYQHDFSWRQFKTENNL